MQHFDIQHFPPAALAAAGTCRTAIAGQPGRTPDLTFLDVVSDNAANNLTVQVPEREYTVVTAAASGQADVALNEVTGLADADVLLVITPAGAITHPVINTSGVNGTTNVVTMSANLGATLPVGTKVFRMITRATVTVGNAAVRLGPLPVPGAIVRGESGWPMRLNLPVTSAGRIGAASATLS